MTMALLDPARAPLLAAALSVAVLHTVVGVDHYLPFIVLGRARKWSLGKVLGITAACGAGHVIGSIGLGFIGIALGTALGMMEWIESVRGSMAAWGLILFGLGYMAWSARRLHKNAEHGHSHDLSDGQKAGSVSFWSLFIVFALGPCEPLIPVLMVPAFEQDWWLVAQVAGLFSVSTIGSMLVMATIGTMGLRLAPLKSVERYGNLAAGFAILASGLAIQFLGI
ncbi:MAG: nickel/cobalt exporter [Cognaticolwellia sp.]|jgi:nickel/cobalt exporter